MFPVTKQIFNHEKTAEQYGGSELFFGPAPGLFDTVNKAHPRIWDFYKEMKSLDWSEDEFDYTQCLVDFASVDFGTGDKMRKTLAYQWEQDSVASRSVAPILAPFVTNSELWAAYQRISDNEVLHAATYSEIVRTSFENPQLVLADILEVKESMQRMETVNKVLSDAYIASHKYALGQIELDQDLYNTLYLMIVSMFIMERVQFMASFAITFTICGTGLFQSIGKAVQRIAQDEFEVHVQLGKCVIDIEHGTERGKIARGQTKSTVERILADVVAAEFKWLDYMFSDGVPLLGTNVDYLKKWVLFNAKDVIQTLDLKHDFGALPKSNPMPHLEKWLNINKVQAAPQEESMGAYKVGIVQRTDNGNIYDDDF